MKRPMNLSYLQLVLIIIVNVTSWRWKSTKCAIWNFFSEEEDKIACNCHESTGRKSSKMFCRAWNSWKKMRLSKILILDSYFFTWREFRTTEFRDDKVVANMCNRLNWWFCCDLSYNYILLWKILRWACVLWKAMSKGLSQQDIKFMKAEGESLFDIKFENRVMKIPRLNIGDDTEL